MKVVLSALLGGGLTAAGLVGVPAHAAETGVVTGTVTGPSGLPVAGVQVDAYRPDGAGSGSVMNTVTGGSGTYRLEGLAPGDDYILGFNHAAGGNPVEYWPDVHAPELAVPFTVSGGTEVVKNAQLDLPRHIRGQVRGPSGAPLPGVVVNAYGINPASELKFAITGDDGRYELTRLPAGTYKIGFAPDGTVTEFWSDTSDFVSAGVIDVTTGDANGKDVVLGGPDVPPVAAIANTAPPRVTGKARVGKRLTATSGSWSPAAVALTYQWLANGKVLKGATKPTLRLKDSHQRKKISVRVTATASGAPAATVTSAPTGKVKRR